MPVAEYEQFFGDETRESKEWVADDETRQWIRENKQGLTEADEILAPVPGMRLVASTADCSDPHRSAIRCHDALAVLRVIVMSKYCNVPLCVLSFRMKSSFTLEVCLVEDFEGKEEPRSSFSRRTFFGLVIGAVVAIAGIVSLDFILPKKAAPETNTSTTVASRTITETGSNTSTVSSGPNVVRVVVVKGTASVDRQVLVDKALEALGGVEKLVPAGATILVKPNVGFYEKDATTDPRITAAVVEALKRAQPNRIVVGESALRGIDVDYALQTTGTRSLAEGAGAEVRDLRKDTVVTVEVPNGLAIKSVNVFRTARDSFIVSVPRLKRHSSTTVTISLKNMIGAAPDDEKGRFHQVNLNQCIGDLNMALGPKLAIIDATEAMTRSGPSGGVMVQLNLVLASTDPVAADLVAAEELFKAEGIADPLGAATSIEHIQNAARLGVGTADPSRIEVMNVSVG